MPRRRPIDHDYTPINCTRCGEPLEIRVNLTIRAPLGWKNLSKDGIRSKFVSVESAAWDLAQFFCGCEKAARFTDKVRQPDPNRKSDEQLKLEARCPLKGRRPGVRWTKGLIPKKPSPYTLKNHRMCRRRRPQSNESEENAG